MLQRFSLLLIVFVVSVFVLLSLIFEVRRSSRPIHQHYADDEVDEEEHGEADPDAHHHILPGQLVAAVLADSVGTSTSFLDATLVHDRYRYDIVRILVHEVVCEQR